MTTVNDDTLKVFDPMDPENNHCRMYRNKYPTVEDMCIVQVKNVAEMGAYVSLLEYDNAEGMILLSELSKKRIRSINKLIRVGRTEVVVVMRVAEEKGYIDLSKRRVQREEIPTLEVKYDKSKKVHAIMRHASEASRIPMIKLYEQFGWDLYDRFGHAYDAFKLLVTDPDTVNIERYNINEKALAALLKHVNRKMEPKAYKLRADINVTCSAYEGIDAIKAALGSALKLAETKELDLQIKLVAPPTYVLLSQNFNKTKGVAFLQECCDTIEAKITEAGGGYAVMEAPRAVQQRDDKLLAALMETLEKQNQEVAGDEAEAEED